MEVLGQTISKVVQYGEWKLVAPASRGPGISHIFSVDYLILCGEASFSQPRKMEHLLATLCGFSGQRVNRDKSRIWFSLNTPRYLQNVICTEFGVLPTSDLGTYFGVPLQHGRLGKHAYQFLLEKVDRRLSGWKRKILSKASRAMLIQSTLAALPVYAMQSALIPKGILAQLNKRCRGFFWGHSETQWALHTVAWSQLCQPIPLGGLGFPILEVLNRSLLSKLIWNLLVRLRSLVVRS